VNNNLIYPFSGTMISYRFNQDAITQNQSQKPLKLKLKYCVRTHQKKNPNYQKGINKE
jgi:hypothetical protein